MSCICQGLARTAWLSSRQVPSGERNVVLERLERGALRRLVHVRAPVAAPLQLFVNEVLEEANVATQIEESVAITELLAMLDTL